MLEQFPVAITANQMELSTEMSTTFLTVLSSSVTEGPFHLSAPLKYFSTPLPHFITLMSELFRVLNALIVYIFTALTQRSSTYLLALFSVIYRTLNQNLCDYLFLMITIGALLCLFELFAHPFDQSSRESETRKKDKDGARVEAKDRAETGDGAEDGAEYSGEADTDATCQYNIEVKEEPDDDNEAEVQVTEDEAEHNPGLEKGAEMFRHATTFLPGLPIKGKAEGCDRDEELDSSQEVKIESFSQVCLQRELEGDTDEEEVEKDWDKITADSEEYDDNDDEGEEERRIHWPLTMHSLLYYTCLYILLGLLLLTRDPKSSHHYHQHNSSSPQAQLHNHCGFLDIFFYIKFFDSILHSSNGTTVLLGALLLLKRNGNRDRDATSSIALINAMYLVKRFRTPLFGIGAWVALSRALALVTVTHAGILEAW